MPQTPSVTGASEPAGAPEPPRESRPPEPPRAPGTASPPGASGLPSTLAAESPPLLPGQEWANALTHGLAAVAGLFAAAFLFWAAAERSLMTAVCCAAFALSAVGVFTASALSHYCLDDPRRLHRWRRWDQGLIYTMIAGTYTPLIWQFADAAVRGPLLLAIWLAAGIGFYSKVVAGYRVNLSGTISYLLLGWLPAIPLAGRVPQPVLFWMAAGGVIYTLGVGFLLNDRRVKYLHAGWHLAVVAAAACHYWAIYHYVARSG